MFKRNAFLRILILFLLASAFNFGQDLDRKDVDPKYKWNLEDLYKTENDWKADKDKISSQIQNVTKYQGR